jgi:glyoxylase-like metal-dependent hydrolase (beta-lactamase superfamily II)
LKKIEMVVGQVITRQYSENVWLIGYPETRQGLIIDPGDQAGEISAKIAECKSKPLAILNTHGHPDHLAAAAELQRLYGIPFMCMKTNHDFERRGSIRADAGNFHYGGSGGSSFSGRRKDFRTRSF